MTVSRHAEHFEKEAESHKNASLGWLAAAAGVAAVTGFLLFSWLDELPNLSNVEKHLQTAYLIRLTAMRVLVFSLLTYMLTFLAKQFSAHRHNHVVNRHRQNALATFDAFMKSTEDQTVRDSVLLQATQAIYLPQGSGYGKSPEPARPSIAGMLRGIGAEK